MQMIRHGFQLDEIIAISIAYFQNGAFNHGFNLTLDYLAAVFWAKHDVVIDIVDAMVCFTIHDLIILLEHMFGNMFVALTGDAPFILPHKGVGFQGRVSIKYPS